MKKVELTLKEQIERSLDGRKQKWVVEKMNEKGHALTDVNFSNKKNGYEDFTESELESLQEILGVKIYA